MRVLQFGVYPSVGSPRHTRSSQCGTSVLTQMPKLYEYFGLIIMFYANEHDPVHVHGKCQGRETRAELVIIDGLVSEVRFLRQSGRPPLSESEQRYFEEIVSAKADDIVQKWIDFFVLHKSITPEVISRRLK
jgi:hypothetical protein